MSSNFREGSKPWLSRNSLLLSAIQCPASEGSVVSKALSSMFQKAWIALMAPRLPSWFLRSRVLRPQFRLQERLASRKRLSCCPAKSLAWAFGLGHGAIVEQRPKHPPDDRSKDVKPHASE